MIKRILVANRGEIAVRIIRTCQELSVESVAVYSSEDCYALHVSMADKAVHIGGPKSTDSYLNIDRIIDTALKMECDAIHPGYGFLSENAEFARKTEEHGITFIGPGHELIRKMGDKTVARSAMEKAGIPVIPGTNHKILTKEEAVISASSIGYPVIIKASNGGGGRGMRVAQNEAELMVLFETARNEAMMSFGNDDMFIEKYIEDPKHIEVQILGDKYGNVIHLGERDCSIQRKNQKVIEECPSPINNRFLMDEICKCAVKAAAEVNYENAGTVEFLVDRNENFYFMEMNTRIQVEHGITELVTGIDLVKEQINIASGKPLTYRQDDVTVKGHAIECRINAEDIKNGFLPSTGEVRISSVPGGAGVRFDNLLYQGFKVSPWYDSMIGKLMVHAPDRETAVKKMKNALCETVLDGVETNINLNFLILSQKSFLEGNYTTGFLGTNLNGILEFLGKKPFQGMKKNQEKNTRVMESSEMSIFEKREFMKHLERESRRELEPRNATGIVRNLSDPGYLELLLCRKGRPTIKDPLKFPGYGKKLMDTRKKTGLMDSVYSVHGKIMGNECVVCSMDSDFLIGSMGIDVGEMITASFDYASRNNLPIVVVTSSGGARMQEGMFSLMQMAKTTMAVKRHSDRGLLYISVMMDPTMGGVTASFASLADVIIAETDATIGFTGPRVIRQTLNEEFPEGFQKALFQKEHGFADMVLDYEDLKEVTGKILKLHRKN